ncbi:MAG: HAMP domain-containing sensor histidine kinase [Rhodospirillales bacterium]
MKTTSGNVHMRNISNNLVPAIIGAVLIAVFTHALAADLDPMERWRQFTIAHEDLELDELPVVAVSLAIYVFVLLYGQVRINRSLVERTKADNRRRIAVEQELREALAARDGFFAAMSHDLKTPVNSIMGFSELMRSQVFGPLGHEKYAEYAEDINRASNMLDLTISQILDISRLSSEDRLAVRDEQFDLMDELHFCCKLIAGWKGGKQVVTISGNAQSTRITFDRTLFRRYVINLLTNSMKYAGRDAEVGIHVLSTVPGGRTYLTVYDNGVGLTSRHLAGVSQRYVRMNENSDAYIDSAGLGLWIVKKIADAHECDFSIKSGSGLGFRVILGIPPARITETILDAERVAC